jgi:hypothetical protein
VQPGNGPIELVAQPHMQTEKSKMHTVRDRADREKRGMFKDSEQYFCEVKSEATAAPGTHSNAVPRLS